MAAAAVAAADSVAARILSRSVVHLEAENWRRIVEAEKMHDLVAADLHQRTTWDSLPGRSEEVEKEEDSAARSEATRARNWDVRAGTDFVCNNRAPTLANRRACSKVSDDLPSGVAAAMPSRSV